MPPKPKFTKEDIIAAALELVSQRGMDALTSRDLGAKLGSSARPIFTVFENMEQVQQQVRAAAMKLFESYALKAMVYPPAFKQVGMQMILFAVEEPKLYQLLFMSEDSGAGSFAEVFARLGDLGPACVSVLQRDYKLTEEEAMELFQHVWIHTFGIGALCATGMCRFTEGQIIEMLGQDFLAMLFHVKSGKMAMPTPVPRREEWL